MTATQEQYAQIEKELFAVVFPCERFHQYIYGKSIVVHSNHKPLESIMKKPLSAAPARLQRMLLRLQKYDIIIIIIIYKPGKDLKIADTLSSAAPNESKPPIHDPFTTTGISTESNRFRVFPTTTRAGTTETMIEARTVLLNLRRENV